VLSGRRAHGQAFDLLVRQARERLYGPDTEVDEARETLALGPRTRKRRLKTLSRIGATRQKYPDCGAFL